VTAHECELPAVQRTSRHRCGCGRRWIAVFVLLVGYRWFPEGQVRFP